MEPEYAFLAWAALVLAGLDLAVAAGVFAVKRRARRLYRTRLAGMKRLNRLVAGADGAGLAREFAAAPEATLGHLRRLLEDASPSPASRAAVRGFLASIDINNYAQKGASSRRPDRRMEAYLALGLSESPGAQASLVALLGGEKRRLGRLVILGCLARQPGLPDIEGLIAGLEAGRPGDRGRELLALAELGPRLASWFKERGLPEGETGLELYLMAARAEPCEEAWEGLRSLALGREDRIGEEAAAALAEAYPASRFIAAFAERPERRFRSRLARLLGESIEAEELRRLWPWFEDPELEAAGIAAASAVLEHHPGSEGAFLALIAEDSGRRGRCLSLAIEHRLPALLYHAAPPLGPGLRAMVGRLLDAERTGIILESLSVPLPRATRAAYVDFLRGELGKRPEASAFLVRHLAPALAGELGLPPPPEEEDKGQIPMKKGDKAFLAALAAAGLALFPAIFAALHLGSLQYLTIGEIAYRYIFDFQYLFAWYTIAVNASYLILLGLSVAKLRAQARLWECGLSRLVAREGMLPPVSIIAPAYNEEKTIVESVHSLLSLAYPSYEVIVVNDGSRDGTLAALVKGFELEPAASGGDAGPAGAAIPSMPVRTVYRSRVLPKLIVIDKANGGKADALNAGLNRAAGEYVCTIDADSILDPQALTRAMFQAVASEREVIAIGGNVFPVNGCSVEHGHLQEISLSEEPLARFQTVEYLRSFVAGRLGWTVLDSLLIISGAFGVFRRGAVTEAGGYLTGKGRLRHDTVGEDMEMVVRLKRADRDKGGRGRIDYCYNANCWTEVPESWAVLRRQRDRWHRGLMEVLCFHKGMAFRPRYGASGLLALPYFYVFELVGPWLELEGYLVLAAALLFNLIDPAIPLLVFAIALLFGILISTASIFLAERQILYFRPKEFFRLLGAAVIENFGFRQLASAARVWSNIQFFFVSKGWQKAGRKGFSKGAAG